MRIEIVRLENIRSHVHSTVPFARGFNCLVGGVASGKSSILYSVDFALFGEPLGRSYDYLLREGSENGKVTVQFVQDSNTYKMTRGLKRRGKGISQDIDELVLCENDKPVSSLNSEAVAEQIKAITGLDRELFREIVWLRQEHFKELLDARPRDRQIRLDGLFGLSDYEVAWNSLGSLERDYEAERKVYERDPDVLAMDRLSSDYGTTAEEYSLVEIGLHGAASRLDSAKKKFEAADAKLRELEKVKAYHEELGRREAQLLASLASLENVEASLSKRLTAKRTAVSNLEQGMKTMNAQIVAAKADLDALGIQTDQPIEVLRQCLTSLDDKITTLKGEKENASKSLQADTKRISSISAENRCPLCLQTLTAQYKKNIISRIGEENHERQRTAAQLRQRIEELEVIKSKMNTAFSNMQLLTSRIGDAKTLLTQERTSLAELRKELEETECAKENTSGQLGSLRAEISRFDVSRLESARRERELTFKQLYAAESELRTEETKKKELLRKLDDLKERIDRAQQKTERISNVARLIGYIGSMRNAYRNIQPELRREFVKVLRSFAQQILDSLIGSEGPMLNLTVDETYTPFVRSENGTDREVSHLSGGERTLLGFAYRLGLGQLIMQSRTGRGLNILLLDEPTESLGREDGSIDRLAEAISRLKAVEQIIAVTHSEAFAEKSEHVVRLEKEAGVSRISVDK